VGVLDRLVVADHGGPAVSPFGDLAQGDVAVPTEKYGDGPSRRGGTESGLHMSVELALMRDHAVAPGGAHDGDVLAQASVPPLEGHADSVELLAHPPCADTQDDPTPGDGVDGGQLLGQHDR
jgi:hypothetical protein